MSKTRASSHSISGVFVFLLLGIFALFATVMVVLGVRAYRGTVERTGVHSNERIAAAYVRGKLRAADEAGGLRVEELEGFVADEDGQSASVGQITTLAMAREMHYVTRYYVYEGMIRRDYADENAVFEPAAGSELYGAAWLDGDSGESVLSAGWDGGTLTVNLTVNGAYNFPRCETVDGVDTVLIPGARLYVFDGSLMRQSGSGVFDPARGEILCPAVSLTARMTEGSMPLDEDGMPTFGADGMPVVENGLLTIEIEADPAYITAETLDGVQTVTIHHPEGETEERITRLFVWDGSLCESTQDTSEPFDPSYGEPICEALALSMAQEGDLMRVRLQLPDESWLEFRCALRAAAQ